MNLPIDECAYQSGYEEAWFEYEPGEPVGDPVGASEDYRFGWWVGICEVLAWNEGWEAADKGVMACPYLADTDDECFREPWHAGYWCCIRTMFFMKRSILQ
jgi:hypothetical protein